MIHYWLFKSEPKTFSIDDLRNSPNQTTHWNGVRNYQVRNMLRDSIKVGDRGFFYHSSCANPGIVGTVIVVQSGHPDDSALDKHSPYFDPRSTKESPRWWQISVKLNSIFKSIISLKNIKQHPELQTMAIAQKGNRLSITPVTSKAWFILCGTDRF